MNKSFILVFGSCGWDKIFYVNSDGSEEFLYEEEGRKNSHQAVASIRAGAEAMLVSFVGDDEIGRKVLKSLKDCGVDTRFVETIKGASTEINYQYVDKITGNYSLKRGPAELSYNYDASMVNKYKEYILKSDCVILVSKQPHDFLTEMINFCYKNNIPTALTVSHKKFNIDVNEDLEALKKVSYIALNYKELCDLFKVEVLNEEGLEKAFTLLPNMIMTKGDEGVWFIDESGKLNHEDAIKVNNVVETNGAGDTFIGNYVVYRSEKKSIKESIRRAICASTLKLTKMGVYSAMPYRKDIDKFYDKYYTDK